MKCPNCRCVVPGNAETCNYCGYEFLSDFTETSYTEGTYYDRFYEDSYRELPYNNTNFYNNNIPVNTYAQSFYTTKKKRRKMRKDRDSRGMNGDTFFISTMVGMSCIAIVLSLLLLII